MCNSFVLLTSVRSGIVRLSRPQEEVSRIDSSAEQYSSLHSSVGEWLKSNEQTKVRENIIRESCTRASRVYLGVETYRCV